MLPDYQLKLADFYNIPIGNVNKLVAHLFDKKNMCFFMKSSNFTRK